MGGLDGFAAKMVRLIEAPFWWLARRVFPAWVKRRRAGQEEGFRVHETGSAFLCDSCKYNWGDICKRPEKPNATECPDYKKDR